MKFKIVNNNYLESCLDSCIVTGIFEDFVLFPSTDRIDKISQGYISSILKQNNAINGSVRKNLLLYDAPYFLNKQIFLVGCGKLVDFNEFRYKEIIIDIIEFCKRENIVKIFLLLSEFEIKGYNSYWKVRHTISLFNDAFYKFYKFKTDLCCSSYCLNEVAICIQNCDDINISKQAVLEGTSVARWVNVSKDLGNMPPNYCTPLYLSNKVQELPKKFDNLSIEILDELMIKKLGMNAYLSVGLGSCYPAIMPIIKYMNNPKGLKENPIVLIGKGLTFDSGGISIKSSDRLDEMKYDMCGASVVYSVICLAAELSLPLNIIGILAVSENMISDHAMRPGDIIKTLSGKTVEILNTDAEGRLVLCDALTYAQRYNPSIIIDIATLTGACVVALGNHFSGLLSNSQRLAQDLLFASKQTRDYLWQFPLHELFEKQLESTFADMNNVGGRNAGVITAACFLKKFVGKYDWAHLDIAGTAWKSENCIKSSTGRPTELLIQFLINRALQSN